MEAAKAHVTDRAKQLWGEGAPGGRYREGYYHLNGALGVYAEATYALGDRTKRIAPRLQRRLAAGYKKTSNASVRTEVGNAAYGMIKAKHPRMYRRANFGKLRPSDVVGKPDAHGNFSSDPFAALENDASFVKKLCRKANCTPEQAIEAIRNEQLLMLHTMTTVDLHARAADTFDALVDIAKSHVGQPIEKAKPKGPANKRKKKKRRK